jgi:hypothetical protein
MLKRMLIGLLVLVAPVWADEKKAAPEKRTGTVIGMVKAKDKYWIEVLADGEEKARRYMPQWLAATPSSGAGLDKKMLETFAKLKLGSRIKIMWEFDERARAIKIDVLKEPEKEPEKDR